MAEIDGLPIQPAIPNNNPTQKKDTHNIWKDYRKLKTYLILRDKNNEKANKTQESERHYTIRKRPASVASSISSSGGTGTADRTTFVCYTCGVDSPSSQLHLVYCCSNAEREPYYPFIKDLEPFQNASPISPQGMVQICSSCLDKNSHRAEGGDPTTVNTSNNNLDALNNSNSNSSTIAFNSNHYHNNGSVSGQNTMPSGRYTPSDKSVSNLDAAGNVRFKPYESNSNSSSGHRGDLKPYRRGDSRPNSPFGSTGPGSTGANGGSAVIENGQGQHTCYVCKAQCSTDKMEWLLTSAEHMNSHAMHFPCLKNQNDTSGTNRVWACKDCVLHLSKQWDNMDFERIPLEKRRYNIPSPMSSNSPSDSRHMSIKPSSSPSTTPSVSSTPTTQSIYCFLCGLHSEFLLARVLYASKEGNRPYFPHLLHHKQHQNAEGLRDDKTALVCTFCYHSLLNQWRKYESQPNPPSPSERNYNWKDYICHVCGGETYRKRVRALPVNEYPNLKNHKSYADALLLENAEYATVCLDCYEYLRFQTSQYDRLGMPLARRQFSWIQQKPPPEDSPDVAVARLPCGERSDKVQITSAMRQLPNKKNSSPKQFTNEKAKEVPPKPVQKRPTTSPAPMIPSPHHLQSPSSGIPQQQPQPPPHVPLPAHALSNHVIPTTNHYPPSIQPSPQAANPTSAGSRQPQGTFASALRNLAKQVDSKDDDERVGGGRGGGGGGSEVDRNSVNQNSHESRIIDHRNSGGTTTVEGERNAKKRSAPSPQPAEKVARLNSSTTASSALQPELMARSGFQPYRSDERLIHPAASFGLEYSSFLPPGVPGYMQAPGGYPPPGFFDPRLDLLRQHQHGHSLYPLGVPPHLYAAMMSGAPAAALGHYSERMKYEEEQQRMRQEEERERSLREKEQREREARELREKEQREREKKEREMREKEQREKEAREREMREKEREEAARNDRERSRLQAMKYYAAQMFNSNLGRSYQAIPPHVAAAYQMQGVRAPPSSLQGLPFPSQGPMGMSLGLGVPPNLPPHLAGHPSFSTLAMSHPGLQLPHLSPHYMQPSMSSAHSLSSQQPPHTSSNSMNLSTSAPTIVTSSPSLYYGHPHAHMPPSSQQQQQTQPISFAAHNHHSPNNKTTAAGPAYPTPTSTPNQNGGRTSISPRVSIPPPSSMVNEPTTLDLTSSHSNQTPTPPVVAPTGMSNGVTTISDSSQSETSKDSISAVPPSNSKDDEKNSPAPIDGDAKQQKSPGENTGNKQQDKGSVKNSKSLSPPPNPETASTTSENIVTSTLDASGCNSPPVVVSSSTSNDVGTAAE
ncbi:hypothetical protein ACFFRR_009006 [Megaselia abdita]